jgi:hypothetical protein
VVVRNASGTPSYPSRTNGTQIYNGTLSYVNDTGLINDVTYYYGLWSYNSTTNLYSTRATQSNETKSNTLEISIDPGSYNFGSVYINSFAKTTEYYFTITNLGMECDINIKFNDSQNWTAVPIAERGYNKFAMNWSDDNWTTERNINPDSGVLMKQYLQSNDELKFDLKVLTPTSVASLTNRERWWISLTITPS